jgi:hypothetical protein
MTVRKYIILCLLAAATPVAAQDVVPVPVPVPVPQAQLVFQSGTGGLDGQQPFTLPMRPTVDCATLELAESAISNAYYSAGDRHPARRLERLIFTSALTKYRGHFCSFGRTAGPAVIVIVDYAKHSSEPRLYRVDLRDGDGLDSPIRVAHGIGSDPDDDGYANFFSNVQESFTSSLGAALGAERYVGINGLSLRLDGLEASNNQMRARDIVVHSYAPEHRRYFNAQHVSMRGRPGSSEGCFVVEPEKRELILQTLENGGFLYAGFGKTRPAPKPPAATVTFAAGTGAFTPVDQPSVPAGTELAAISETIAGTPDSPPTNPILQDPAE